MLAIAEVVMHALESQYPTFTFNSPRAVWLR